MGEHRQMASIIAGCGVALYMINRLKDYLLFRNTIIVSSRKNLDAAIVRFYTLILKFLLKAIEVSMKSTMRRWTSAFGNIDETETFESNCEKLAAEVEHHIRTLEREATRPTRQANAETRKQILRSLEELKLRYQTLEQSTLVIEKRTKIMLRLNLPCAQSARWDAMGGLRRDCHPETRIDLLRQIKSWALDSNSRRIFWLNGMAGTGKSTVSHTIAKWLDGSGTGGRVNLGASFFFKRGEGERGSAAQFFPTIATQLAERIPGLEAKIEDEISVNPGVFHKQLGEQFDVLIYRPLTTVTSSATLRRYIIVIDALDECENAEQNIQILLRLFARLQEIPTLDLRLFITSRPETSISQEFRLSLADVHAGIRLQEIPTSIIQHDLMTFIKDELSNIAKTTPDIRGDWPGPKALHQLTNMAYPLFIAAATLVRMIGDDEFEPEGQLEELLRNRTVSTATPIQEIYLSVLQQITASTVEPRKKAVIISEFQLIVGAIVVLADPLSVDSLGALLNVSARAVRTRLSKLHSVIEVPSDTQNPVRALHLSFPEFLLSEDLKSHPCGIDGPKTHRLLAQKCLALMSGSNGLRENICGLGYPGQPRSELPDHVLQGKLPQSLRYACRHWTHHLQRSLKELHDDGEEHNFLRTHLLHWLETLSLMGILHEALHMIADLQKIIRDSRNHTWEKRKIQSSANHSASGQALMDFLDDARRFLLSYRNIVDLAPLQIYSSALIFSPEKSIVRNQFKPVLHWVSKLPSVPKTWGAEIQKLEGHISGIRALIFSPGGSRLASSSSDRSVRFWDPSTGLEIQKIPVKELPYALAFSPNGTQLAIPSGTSVKLCDTVTGVETSVLQGHESTVRALAFSSQGIDGTRDFKGLQLASGGEDGKIRLWDAYTRSCLGILKGHILSITALAFSPGESGSVSSSNRANNPLAGRLLASSSEDCSIRIWRSAKRGHQPFCIQEGHSVTSMSFSSNGRWFAYSESGGTIKLWDRRSGHRAHTIRLPSPGPEVVMFSPDSLELVNSSGYSLQFWDPMSGQKIREVDVGQSTSTIAYSADGRRLATGSTGGTIRLWDVALIRRLQTSNVMPTQLRQPRGLEFSSDGRQLACMGGDATVTLWDTATGRKRQTLSGLPASILRANFSPDDTLLVILLENGILQVWSLLAGKLLRTFERPPPKDDWRTCGWAICDDGLFFGDLSITTGLKVMNLSNGQVILHNEKANPWSSSLTFSPDGSKVACGEGENFVIYQTHTRDKYPKRFRGHSRPVSFLTFSPDGKRIASMSGDQTIRIWDVATSHMLWRFEKTSSPYDLTFVGNSLQLDTGTQLDLTRHGTIQPGFNLTPNSTTGHREWIQVNSKNFLWLPQEYRPVLFLARAALLVIARDSGNLLFVKFKFSSAGLQSLSFL